MVGGFISEHSDTDENIQHRQRGTVIDSSPGAGRNVNLIKLSAYFQADLRRNMQ